VRELPPDGYRWRHEKTKERPDTRRVRPRGRVTTLRGIVWRGSGHECEGVDPMGRGRAKAKQTKVARDLKYRSHETDFGALAQELHGTNHMTDDSTVDDGVVDEHDDWADYSGSGSRD